MSKSQGCGNHSFFFLNKYLTVLDNIGTRVENKVEHIDSQKLTEISIYYLYQIFSS